MVNYSQLIAELTTGNPIKATLIHQYDREMEEKAG